MASGGNEDEKEALCCLCFKQLNADDQALAIQCSAGHYICANDPRLVGGRCAASFVRSQTETSPMSYTPPIECPKCGAPVVWPTFLRFLERERKPRVTPESEQSLTMMSLISGRVELDDLAQLLGSIGLSSDAAVLADLSSKLRKDGVMALEDLKGLSEDEMKEEVAALNLKRVQFNKLFKAVSEL